MSQKYTRKYNWFTIIGWFACFVILICLIYNQVIMSFLVGRISSGDFNTIQIFVWYFNETALIFLVLSYINYIRPFRPPRHIIMYVLLGILILFRFGDMIIGFQWGVVSFLKEPVKLILPLVLVKDYWDQSIIPKFLASVKGLLILLLILIGLSAAPYIGKIALYLRILEIILIMAWFGLGIPQKKSSILRKIKSGQSQSATSLASSGNGIPPSSDWNHGIPRLLYWCDNCNLHIRKRRKLKMDIQNKHECPTCGTTLKAWWTESTQEIYFKLVIGLTIMCSGLGTLLFNRFWGYGLYPILLMSLVGVEFIIGFVKVSSTMRIMIDSPPAYASETPSMAPRENLLKEVIIIGLIVVMGAIIGYFINIVIAGLFSNLNFV